MKSKPFKYIMAAVSLVFAATLSVGCYKLDLEIPPMPKYEDREVGNFNVRFFEDYCEIAGLTAQGNEQRFLIIPEYIDGVRVDSLGLYKRVLYPSGSRYWDLEISSEQLEKVYFEGPVKAARTVFRNNDSLEKVFCLELQESLRELDSSKFNTYFPRSIYEGGDMDSRRFNKQPANVSYYYNYENAEESDYYWFDDCDYGGKIEFIPKDPVRSGYEFGGWYKEAECINAWDFEADTLPELQTEFIECDWMNGKYELGELIERPVYQETILYAKWTEKNEAQD